MIQEESSLMITVINRRNNWLGHVLRENSLMKIVLEGRTVGKKAVGRLRVMLLDWMLDDRNNRTYQNVKDLTQNKKAW